jgi:beta-lactamase class C
MPQTGQLNRAIAGIDAWLTPTAVSAAAVVVRHKGEFIAAHYAGTLDDGLPVRDDTLFALASVTKPFTAAGVMALVDDGLIGLDEPVARFVPEFGLPASDGKPDYEAGRALITVRQVLSHTSGLPEDLPTSVIAMRDQPSLETIILAMARAPLQYQPGNGLRYSNAGYGVLGRLIENVSGEETWTFIRRRVLDPMKLDGIVARPVPSHPGGIATVIDAGAPGTAHEPYQSPYWRDLAIPWGGIFGTAAAVAEFAEEFHRGGRLPLSSTARKLMISDQAGGVSGGLQMLKLVWSPAFWGLGWEVKGSKRRHWTGDYAGPNTYCHWGAAGTLVWSDPDLDLTVAMFGNRLTVNGWPFQPIARWARLSNAIIAAVVG